MRKSNRTIIGAISQIRGFVEPKGGEEQHASLPPSEVGTSHQPWPPLSAADYEQAENDMPEKLAPQLEQDAPGPDTTP